MIFQWVWLARSRRIWHEDVSVGGFQYAASKVVVSIHSYLAPWKLVCLRNLIYQSERIILFLLHFPEIEHFLWLLKLLLMLLMELFDRHGLQVHSILIVAVEVLCEALTQHVIAPRIRHVLVVRKDFVDCHWQEYTRGNDRVITIQSHAQFQ